MCQSVGRSAHRSNRGVFVSEIGSISTPNESDAVILNPGVITYSLFFSAVEKEEVKEPTLVFFFFVRKKWKIACDFSARELVGEWCMSNSLASPVFSSG